MKRYKLVKDLPTFKAGEIFYLTGIGNLLHESEGVVAYSWTTLEKFPNILTDWFEEIKEPTRWKPETNQKYYFLDSDGLAYNNIWADDSIDRSRSYIGNCFKTKEEAERVAEYLKALATVRGDATSKFTKGRDNFYVVYNVTFNCLDVSDNAYIIKDGTFGLPYFATKEDAQRSIELHKSEWLTLFGIEEAE